MVVMMFGYGASWPFWEVALMWVGMIAFWGFLIWAVYALITSATHKPDAGQRSEDPRRILDGRLARGEIDTAEYQRLRDLIAPGDHQAPAGTGGRR
jgi:putative membrane protein